MPETLNLNYYYGNEADQYSFYRIPKILLTDRRYKGVLLEAKVLYGLLLDRMGLSARNGWTIAGACSSTSPRKKLWPCWTAARTRRRSCSANWRASAWWNGKSRARDIPPAFTLKILFWNRNLPRRFRLRKISSQECGISAPNNTDINKTEKSDTDLSIPPPAPSAVSSPAGKRAPRRMGLDEMESYCELILENEVIKSRFLKLNSEHIGYVMDSLKSNTAKIGNIKAYTLAALYNAPVTMGQYYTSLVSHDMAHGLLDG